MAIGPIPQTGNPASTPPVDRNLESQYTPTSLPKPETGQNVQIADLTQEQIRDAAVTIGEALGLIQKSLRVEIDNTTNRIVTQIINRDTNEVIRQIPSEELIQLARRFRELVGILFDREI